MNSSHPVRLVAVVGGSGAGKGWLVTQLSARLPNRLSHLQLDDFYRDCSHLPTERRAKVNFDHPDSLDWDLAEHVLLECRQGRAVRMPSYDFATHSRVATREQVWQPKPIVIVDGLWLLRLPWIRELFSLRVYLEVPTELRCRRRLIRDANERGYTTEAIKRQLQTVIPMHDRYVEPQKEWADIVLKHPVSDAQIDDLAARIANVNPAVATCVAAAS